MVDSEEIQVPSLIAQLPETLFMFQRKRYLCDVMIITANGFIPAHRVVLVGVSQYFYEADTMRTYASSKDPNFHLNYDIEDVRKVVNLLYTGKLMINKFNVDRIAAICAELRLNEALEKCLVFMAGLGIANNEKIANLPERRTGSVHNLDDAEATNNGKRGAYDIFNTEDDNGGSVKKSVSKRKRSTSVNEIDEHGKSEKKSKRAVTKKAKKSQTNRKKSLTNEESAVPKIVKKSPANYKSTEPKYRTKSPTSDEFTELKNGNEGLKIEEVSMTEIREGSMESVITIQPMTNSNISVEESVNQGEFTESQIDPSYLQDQTSDSFMPETSGEFTKEATPTEKDVETNELQPCMFLDLNELKVYQSKPQNTEKMTITKEFDPDGAITESYGQDQEFLGNTQVEKRVNCRTCKMVFKDAQSLTEHRREIHPSNFKKQKFVCDICNAKPNNHVTLVEHKFRKHGITYDKSKYPIYKCDAQVHVLAI
jgi:hypothetical protein